MTSAIEGTSETCVGIPDWNKIGSIGTIEIGSKKIGFA